MSSTFGTLYKVSTFGESHGKAVGAIVDGCPANLQLTEADIQPQLTRRRPGQSDMTTPRDEADRVTILSGCEQGKTLGTPIGLMVNNRDQRPGDYQEMSNVRRPLMQILPTSTSMATAQHQEGVVLVRVRPLDVLPLERLLKNG